MVQPNGEPIHSSRSYDRDHKIYLVISALQPEELDIVGDIILNPPAEEPYTELRNRLSSQYAESEKQNLRDLISECSSRLPAYEQQILAISNDQLEKLAEMADGIMAAAGAIFQ
ncbi:uncharacterized protein NPIL_234701 [Nephila pilipes]|uniref:DUF7041 domain-containing protein n=1 Tax=Nephila pilipes TaxID=299642 RepID=A0A8X6Q7D2_NEPPI|nr:uncharacterized protein NPIL_234701 [Nephila pilipes]